MSKLIEELLPLCAKIKDGTATSDDRMVFDCSVAIHCMDENLLLYRLEYEYLLSKGLSETEALKACEKASSDLFLKQAAFHQHITGNRL